MKTSTHLQALAPQLFAAALLLATATSALAAVHYVDVNGMNATPPYISWTTAATTIQDAVDSAAASDEIVVTNGIYASGGRAVHATMTNRVAVDKPLTLRSINGSKFTFILGSHVPSASGNGDGAIRCVYLINGASLSGFTLTGGATRVVNDYPTNSQSTGGGLWCESNNGVVVSNCVVSGNSAFFGGGGAYQGTLNNCMLTNNSAPAPYGRGGGAFGCTLNNCTLSDNSAGVRRQGIIPGTTAAGSGGGAHSCTLNNCTLNGNLAYSRNSPNDAAWGGGAHSCTLNNCTLTGNSALSYSSVSSTTYSFGGGASICTLNNCTLIGNSADRAGGSGFFAFGDGGGAYQGTLNNCTLIGNYANFGGGGANECALYNCIIYNNTAGFGSNYNGGVLNHCCTTPQPATGVGNITYAPLFVDLAASDLRLQSNSPCINAGLNAFAPVGPELDGNPRISGGTVDIGAHEFQSPTSIISYAWLQQFNLPVYDQTDNNDPDRDGLNNWQEWRCGTDPTNALSALRMLAPSPVGADLVVRWESVADRTYFLEWSTNLRAFSPFVLLSTNLTGEAGTTAYTHANTAGVGVNFYRVSVP